MRSAAAKLFLLICLAGFTAGCSIPAASLPANTDSVATSFIQEATILPQTPATSPIGTLAVGTKKTAIETATTADTPTVTQGQNNCVLDYCSYRRWFYFNRPIAPPGNNTIDVSYRFGSTQDRKRDPHHGVEFLNSSGTPVLAAASGVVVVAGDDRDTLYGPYSYFYGNLIILEHNFSGLGYPVFSLYAHLSEILVKVGQKVDLAQEIGKVGMTGVATGSHLHFEVRLYENSYTAARNPELWLVPLVDMDGELMGALAGRIIVDEGYVLKIPSIVIDSLGGSGGPILYSLYTGIYEEKMLLGLTPWEENFAIGDLPAGWYRVSLIQNGYQEKVVEVLPGQLTVLTFDLRTP